MLAMNAVFHQFKQKITHPLKYKLFLFTKLPMAFIAGLQLTTLEEQQAVVSVQYKWLNQNPFQSIYFAVLSMAAELSTGILAFGHIYQQQPSVSMLVVNCTGSFHKKAVGKITFVCNDGKMIENAILQAKQTGEGVTINCTSTGTNEKGEAVATFVFTWSFRAKSLA